MKIYLVIKNEGYLDSDGNPQYYPHIMKAFAEKSCALEYVKEHIRKVEVLDLKEFETDFLEEEVIGAYAERWYEPVVFTIKEMEVLK